MKQTLKYQFLSLYQKLKCDIRLVVDDRSVWMSTTNDNMITSLMLNPFIGLTIERPAVISDTGARTRAEWNVNDSLSMTKYTLPTMIRELTAIRNDIMMSDMYKYTDNRLELNTKLADKSRRVFMIGRSTIELTIITITQSDKVGEDVMLEGIKMKFNNETSTVQLTINELDALIYNLDRIDIDTISLSMYTKYAKGGARNFNSSGREVVTDIQPL